MSYRKWKGEDVFNGYKILPGNYVLITDEKGIVADIVNEQEAGDDVQQLNGILCPGFINTHCHLELSHMKGMIPEGTGLVDFILQVVNNRHSTEEEIYAAIEKAEDEMLQQGIVAVGDICNNTLSIPQKKKGRLQYHNFIEVSGFPPSVASLRFEKSTAILDAYNSELKTINSLSPHAPYSVSPALFALINEHTKGQVVTIHNQETAAEDEFFKTATGDFVRLYKEMNIDISFYQPSGKSSLQTWLPQLNNQEALILVHNVNTSEEDMTFVSGESSVVNRPLYYCICPNANLYISNTLPDIKMLMQQTANIVLGTDSLASNHQLSIWSEIQTLQRHFPELKLETMLQWATLNGAKALQMDKQLGSFEKDKQPGVLLLQDNVRRLI